MVMYLYLVNYFQRATRTFFLWISNVATAFFPNTQFCCHIKFHCTYVHLFVVLFIILELFLTVVLTSLSYCRLVSLLVQPPLFLMYGTVQCTSVQYLLLCTLVMSLLLQPPLIPVDYVL